MIGNFNEEAQNILVKAKLEMLDLNHPYIGTEPRYPVLKRQGYKILILKKDLVFYKIDEVNKKVIIYEVVDQ